jgi:choline dehydrogenase
MLTIPSVQDQLVPNPDELTNNKTYAAEQLALYFSKRQGPYTIVNEGGNTVAFLPLPNITSSYQSIINLAKSQDNSVYGPGLDSTILDGYCAQREIILSLYGSTDASVQETGWNGGDSIPITLVKPLSRGSVSLNSTDILQSPLIDWKAFTFPSDIEIMVAALRINRKFVASDAMQELKPVEIVPGSNVTTDDEIKVALRQQVVPTYSHPCCTCSMMKKHLGGVVDAQLKVHGVENLRVVDASIMPLIPATHTSATVYAVAEKAADIIKERWEHGG